MTDEEAREALAAVIAERREDFAGLSRLLGRNPAYIQQYIRRGSPRRLSEQDRRTLANYLRVPEARLGGPPPAPGDASVRVRRLDVGASAGAGAALEDEAERDGILFDPRWLRRIASVDPDLLSLIRVTGDSMAPTLLDGDEILVAEGAPLRDGVYVLRMDEGLMVKRLAFDPSRRRVSVLSDNPAWPSWPDCDPRRIRVVGRVVWSGRAFH